jgi:hypothetical protein
MLSGGIVTMKVKTPYLQLLARPERGVPPWREGLAVVHAKKQPSLHPVRSSSMEIDPPVRITP